MEQAIIRCALLAEPFPKRSAKRDKLQNQLQVQYNVLMKPLPEALFPKGAVNISEERRLGKCLKRIKRLSTAIITNELIHWEYTSIREMRSSMNRVE